MTRLFVQHYWTQKNSVMPVVDMRCTKEPHNKIVDEVIRQHISTFNPTISHYRREHPPRRLYLPSDLSFIAMNEDFLNKNPNFKCSYEKYRGWQRKWMCHLLTLGIKNAEVARCLTYIIKVIQRTISMKIVMFVWRGANILREQNTEKMPQDMKK